MRHLTRRRGHHKSTVYDIDFASQQRAKHSVDSRATERHVQSIRRGPGRSVVGRMLSRSIKRRRRSQPGMRDRSVGVVISNWRALRCRDRSIKVVASCRTDDVTRPRVRRIDYRPVSVIAGCRCCCCCCRPRINGLTAIGAGRHRYTTAKPFAQHLNLLSHVAPT